jgi:hypothetical protein
VLFNPDVLRRGGGGGLSTTKLDVLSYILLVCPAELTRVMQADLRFLSPPFPLLFIDLE